MNSGVHENKKVKTMSRITKRERIQSTMLLASIAWGDDSVALTERVSRAARYNRRKASKKGAR